MVALSTAQKRFSLGLLYAWSGFGLMWAVWAAFIIFLCEPRRLLPLWPLPTVDQEPVVAAQWAALIDLALVAVFGLQHSVMARPWFKERIMAGMAPAFQRCTYVHMANLALLAVVVFWQPIPVMIWHVDKGFAADLVWLLFAAGWLILFAGGWSFGLRELLGVTQMQAWIDERRYQPPRLKTGFLYRWLRHPMYVGVLLGVWATPRMSIGHCLLALALTGYVLIGMRYEERDLARTFGARYHNWRKAAI
jgi:protein-S-isoprenylcysteine O-methyltransferase Ste14